MNRTILRNLEDIVNAPKMKAFEMFIGYDYNGFEFDDEKKAKEVESEIIENMTKKELKELVVYLNENSIDSDINEGIFYFEFEKYAIAAAVHENIATEYDFDDWAKNIISIIVYEKEEIKELPVAILNTTILTVDGDFSLKTISLEDAKDIIKDKEITSAVGHQATSDILKNLLGIEAPVNRINFEQKPGQKAICFKLKGRAPEGKILSVEEMIEMGYEFKLLEMKKGE